MNTTEWLFLLDVDNIQGYIFDTNKLRTIIGASWLVDHINAADDGDTFTLLKNFKFGTTPDEIRKNGNFIYSSGGNTKLIFGSDTEAEDFENEMTKIYADYGISVTTHVQEVQGGSFIKDTMLPAEKTLAQKKYNKAFKRDMVASPYFKICEWCGKRYASVKIRDDIVCHVCGRKYEKGDEAFRLFPHYSFVTNMDKMKLQTGMIGTVVMDGNRMGDKINGLGSKEDLKEFAEAAEDAIKESFDCCLSELFPDEKASGNFVSVRPLIMGGDDICFIVDAASALDFVDRFREKAEGKTKAKASLFGQEGIQFSAGILFTKPNYPFNFAYRIAHSLLNSAKRYSREQADCSSVDFHFLLSSSGDEIEVMREMEYRYEGHLLTQKPYPANEIANLKNHAKNLQVLARNKVKGFRKILRLGKEQSTVELLKHAIRMDQNTRNQYRDLINQYGWQKLAGEDFWRTGLMDLAELTDLTRR